MSTNSCIRIKRTDGTETGIYCHWDGYIEHNGVLLQLCYNTAEKVEALLKLGDLSVLGEYIAPENGTEHTFDNPQRDVCVAYHRDRGEDYEQSNVNQEFTYIFDERHAVWFIDREEYIEGTRAMRAIELEYAVLNRERLLLDEIIENAEQVENGWSTDEFAAAGEVVQTCIQRAKEARQEIIEQQRAAYDIYCWD